MVCSVIDKATSELNNVTSVAEQGNNHYKSCSIITHNNNDYVSQESLVNKFKPFESVPSILIANDVDH